MYLLVLKTNIIATTTATITIGIVTPTAIPPISPPDKPAEREKPQIAAGGKSRLMKYTMYTFTIPIHTNS